MINGQQTTTSASGQATTTGAESILWLVLALAMALYVDPSSWTSWNVVGGALLMIIALPSTLEDTRSGLFWRQGAGGCMSAVVLIPTLLHAMALYTSSASILWYAKLTSFLWIQDGRMWGILVGVMALYYEPNKARWPLVYAVSFYSIRWYPSLHQVFTKGEWMIVTAVTSIAVTEWFHLLVFTADASSWSTHSIVGLSGVVGCLAGCAITTRIQHPFVRGGLLVAIPLVTVEATLWRTQPHNNDDQFPLAITWLIQFLMERPDRWPRFVWLLYWAVVGSVAFFFSFQPKQDDVASIVIARKWFHLVAVVLFLPVTILDRQMMSLSYCIALCVLLVLESMRTYLSETIKDFYQRYLDPQKDVHDKIVISHISLILGCAMPLWISECCTGSSDNTLLPLFGILVLGVGDSCAAVIGVLFGRIRLGTTNNRTVEGSAAMWTSMVLCCALFFASNYYMAAITFTTLLEAVTTEIDNLLLPLAGATVLLLQSTT